MRRSSYVSPARANFPIVLPHEEGLSTEREQRRALRPVLASVSEPVGLLADVPVVLGLPHATKRADAIFLEVPHRDCDALRVRVLEVQLIVILRENRRKLPSCVSCLRVHFCLFREDQ